MILGNFTIDIDDAYLSRAIVPSLLTFLGLRNFDCFVRAVRRVDALWSSGRLVICILPHTFFQAIHDAFFEPAESIHLVLRELFDEQTLAVLLGGFLLLEGFEDADALYFFLFGLSNAHARIVGVTVELSLLVSRILPITQTVKDAYTLGLGPAAEARHYLIVNANTFSAHHCNRPTRALCVDISIRNEIVTGLTVAAAALASATIEISFRNSSSIVLLGLGNDLLDKFSDTLPISITKGSVSFLQLNSIIFNPLLLDSFSAEAALLPVVLIDVIHFLNCYRISN